MSVHSTAIPCHSGGGPMRGADAYTQEYRHLPLSRSYLEREEML